MKKASENFIKKPFKKGDLVLYGIIAVITILLFVLAALIQTGETNSFCVYYNNELVLTYHFDDDSFIVEEAFNKNVEVESNKIKITVDEGYNEITIENGKIKVTDTDCGLSKECTFMSLENGAIICAPHKLKIVGVNENLEPSVG